MYFSSQLLSTDLYERKELAELCDSIKHRQYDFIFDNSNVEYYFSDVVYKEIIASETFQRLESIKFLGAIDYSFRPNGQRANRRHSRLEHSLGVAILALIYSSGISLPKRERQLLIISALLHDIGHSPLSHSLEPALKENFSIDHHVASEMIITGKSPLGDELPIILKKHGFDPNEIVDILAGKYKSEFSEVMSGSINIDTLEGIPRSSSYYMKQLDTMLSPPRLVEAFIDLNEEKLDQFWEKKHKVYSRLIQSKKGLLCDYISRYYLSENISKFEFSDFFLREDQLRKKHKAFFQLLSNPAKGARLLENSRYVDISFMKRTFYIDPDFKLMSSNDCNKRYKQTKRSESIRIDTTRDV